MTPTEGGVAYRDLNRNGWLDPYEDPRRPIAERVEDLLRRMTLEEKAGLMFHTMAGRDPEEGAFPGLPSAAEMISQRYMNHFNAVRGGSARELAEWANRLQELAAATRLGIPVTISSDPRHAFAENVATGFAAGAFSQWPEPIGLAAIGDSDLVFTFADIARQEYLAVGIRVALHPMADLATEPRWGRIAGTFGEDAGLAASLVHAYVRGFQGEPLGPRGVACMTKHFPGGGPQKDGEDPHFPFGKEQVYPGNNFDHHLIPFEAAFAAGTAQIMPYYGKPVGLPLESVGFGFNQTVINGLLRERYGFDGVVCTDWGLLTDAEIMGRPFPARAWGVEHLGLDARAKKALDAGADQFGGAACPEVVVRLVRGGQVPEARIDLSVRRILRDKFRLGLFEDPFVDPDRAERVVGNPRFRAAGELAQRRSIVLLRNARVGGRATLPLGGRPRVYVENLDPETARGYGEVVSDPRDADVAILRLKAPFEKRQGFLEGLVHSGDLGFPEEEKARVLALLETVPTVVDILLDRPAVIPEIAGESAALMANFGASDAAVLDVVFGRFAPAGRLPFALPSSMESVRRQKSDVPFDLEDPLFPFGYGLTY